MKQLKMIVVGNVDCPMTVENVLMQIKVAKNNAKLDNKHFDRGIVKYGLNLIDNNLWLVGYTKYDLSDRD